MLLVQAGRAGEFEVFEGRGERRVDLVINDQFQAFEGGDVDIFGRGQRVVHADTKLGAVEAKGVGADEGSA